MGGGYRLVKSHNIVGTNQHHSGWPWIIEHLKRHEDPDGLLVDDFAERTLAYCRKTPKEFPYKEPFIAIFHHSDDVVRWCVPLNQRALRHIVATERWQRIKPMARGAIALSEHAGNQLRRLVDIPVYVLRHPIAPPEGIWSIDAWREHRRVAQVGYYGRNVRLIFQIPPKAGYSYLRFKLTLPSVQTAYERHDTSATEHYKGIRKEYPGVIDRLGVIPKQYDRMLRSTVVVTELLAGSANNVVLECIVRATPIVINRYPSIVEYIGADYPLYFEDISEIPALLDEHRLIAAHEYLREKNTNDLTIERFTEDFFHVVAACS